MSVIEKIFGTHSDHELKRIKKTVDKIMSLQPAMAALTDEQLQHKTVEFKEMLAKGKTLDDILPEAFAAIREADKRVLGMEPFRVQVTGGVILHQGRIAEMRTGEGKTLVATLPSYLNALEGKGVHVITVNEYLSARDAKQMGEVHKFMGLSVGCVLSSMSKEQRKEQYACDITYVTNSELGFDYLRDNMATAKRDRVQRGLNYAIIDEVDSILIDDARTPLIISIPSDKPTNIYLKCDFVAKLLERGEASGEFSKMDALMGEEITETGDFIVNEKDKIVTLTAEGIKKVENLFHVKNYSDAANLELQHNMSMALQANYIMHRDRNYVVRDGKVEIVDENTGRIMEGRRYSDGLHQAIEAKEKVEINKESQTAATVTYQNFFNKYTKKAGMTGTAATEEEEFRTIYGLDVVTIPTNKPIARKDYPDYVYMTKKEKYKAICDEVVKAHSKHQPVLVGTVDIETSELISKLLTERGIPHEVLNAKNDEREAEIVALAGQADAVTVATNMAGRGTDIKLDEEARAAGGLKVIGSSRHESRRIDNQLRGRSGRQGDPGETRFYISLEDDLMKQFGSDKMMRVLTAMKIPEGEPLDAKMLSSAIEDAQSRIEDNNFSRRKNVLSFDKVNNEQRELIYGERNKVLDGNDMRQTVINMIEDDVTRRVGMAVPDHLSAEEWDLTSLNSLVRDIVPGMKVITAEELKATKIRKKKDLVRFIKERALKLYEEKETEAEKLTGSQDAMREVERNMLLTVIDRAWKSHLDDMDQLKQWIGIQAYGQKDPVNEYHIRAYSMFNAMTQTIQDETVRLLYRVVFYIPVEQNVEENQREE